ncbi:MAG: UbiA family prenyltransferase [Woeseiaceae bacterium]
MTEHMDETNSPKHPLFVDLDGTLLKSDLLLESAFALLKLNFLYVFLMPFWLAKGKANLKQQIAQRVDLDVSLLPYHPDFLAFLRSQKAAGRRLVLATASHEKYAQAIADHLTLFDAVIASSADLNLSGERKLQEILKQADVFDYAGNAMVDLPIWKAALSALVVNAEHGVLDRARDAGNVSQVFDDRVGHRAKPFIKAMRLHQWLKNALIFVPIVVTHSLADIASDGVAFVAFIAFGLCASSVYLLNDLLDLADDRKHATKCMRPFAAGSVSIVHGTLLIPVLLIVAFLISLALPTQFTMVLGIYYLITVSYSIRLKQAALVDVMVLASLYTMRIIAGAAALGTYPSFWLLTFSMFLFLSLALVKRYTELLAMQERDNTTTSGRGYRAEDINLLSQFGTTSACISILVLALYINSNEILELYSKPYIIWMLCPLTFYVITRIWLLARRRELDEDPVVFVIKDRRSQWLGVVAAILLWLAI